MKTRKRVATIAAAAAQALGIVSLLERRNSGMPLLRVLTYHRIGNPQRDPDLNPGLTSATEREFENQVSALAERCNVVGIEQVLAVVRGEGQLPDDAVLITFDDAYTDFAGIAWPILKRLSLPVTLFVPTAFPGDPQRRFWWDRVHRAIRCTTRETLPGAIAQYVKPLPMTSPIQRRAAYVAINEYIKSMPHREAMDFVDQTCDALGGALPEARVLTWDELRSLARDGVTLAPHTRTHPLLGRACAELIRTEVRGSMEDLVRELEDVTTIPPVFAYPSGSTSDEARRLLAELGMELVFTTERGINNIENDDPLALRRINVGLGTRWPLLRLQLAGIPRRN